MVHKGNVVNQVPEYVRKYIYERSNVHKLLYIYCFYCSRRDLEVLVVEEELKDCQGRRVTLDNQVPRDYKENLAHQASKDLVDL